MKDTFFRGLGVVASILGVSVVTLVACTVDPAPARGTTPEAGSPEASSTPPADAGFPVLPYPPGPYGLGIGEVMPNVSLEGYRLSRTQRDPRNLGLASVRLSEVRSDPQCGCMVLLYNAAGKGCSFCNDTTAVLTNLVSRDSTLCAAEIIAFSFDALDFDAGGPPPPTHADLDGVVQDARPTFPVGLTTPSVHQAGFDVIQFVPSMFVVRPTDMRILAFTGGAGDLESRIHTACATPWPAVETVAGVGTGLTAPRRMVKDKAHLYFSDQGHVVRLPLAGGALETVATPQTAPDAIALDDDHVYWATHDGAGTFEIGRIAKTGGSPETLTSGAAGYTSIALDDTSVWFTRADGVIGSIPRSGGPETTFTTEVGASSIAVDATSIYWIAESSVVTQAKVAGTRTVLAQSSDFGTIQTKATDPVELELAAAQLFVRTTRGPFGGIARIPTDGGAPLVVASDLPTALGVAPSGNAFYASTDVTFGGTAIQRFEEMEHQDNRIQVTLGQRSVANLVADDAFVWWTDVTDAGAALKRIAKP